NGSGSLPPRALRTVATWSMFTPRRRWGSGILFTSPGIWGRQGGGKPQRRCVEDEDHDLKLADGITEAFPLRPLRGHLPPMTGGGEFLQFLARSTALMAGVARSAAVMSARCLTSATSTSITMSKKSIERLTMRRLEMLPSWRAITVDRLDRLPGWLATVILSRPG